MVYEILVGPYSSCPGLCYRIKRPSFQLTKGFSPYENGLARCVGCNRFFETEEKYCECCGRQLRKNARFRHKRKRVVRYIS